MSVTTRNVAALTPPERREWIELLYKEGKTDQQIAEYLSLDRAGVTRVRNAMGLNALYGHAERKWTASEETAILMLRDDWGMRWVDISRGLGYGGKEAKMIAEHYLTLKEAQEQAEQARLQAQNAVEKKCLRCRRPFMATDRKREWYCAAHREAAASYGDFADEYRMVV